MLESRLPRAPGGASGGSFVTGLGTGPGPRRSTIPMPSTIALDELIHASAQADVRGDASVAVADVVYRSADVTPGALFFCVPGSRVDGHDFAVEASGRGASVLVVERWLEIEGRVAQVLVPSVRHAMGPMAAAFFGRPSERMALAGVTGTNGKTTTTYLLESVFRAAGMRPGVIGTTGVRIAGRPIPFDRTTPEAPDLQRLLASMVREGVGAAAMEVSSHGLDQHRVDGCRYACSIFTNLSQDHLDYHGTMEEYFAAKARLFTEGLSENGAVNVDSKEGRLLAKASAIPVVTFGTGPDAEIRAEDVVVAASGVSFRVGEVQVRSKLRAHFNVSNALGAFAAGRLLGLDDEVIATGIGALQGVPGRLEPVDGGQPFTVLVDYAHTPDSVDNVLRAARGLTDGRVIVVFGCGGDRDRGKRPLMGEAATRLADLAVVTSDNPRSEVPEAIIEEILPGARRGGGDFTVEPDRRAAIRLALREARPGDVVVVAGKGHESGQEFADRTIPFDDRLVAAEEIAVLLGSRP
jgi:UDP-N-acetylmuramoyl-L-alanyl-D-glutamate--2,6-diaminopimelate ligase